MKKIRLTPSDYHALLFDVSKLPDVAAAGPVSASILSKSRDPLNFLLDRTRETTSSMEWGSLVDCLWTTPELFSEEYIVLPDDAPQRPTKAMLEAKKPGEESLSRQRWWSLWEAKSAGKTSIAEGLYNDALAAVRMLNMNSLAKELHEKSEKQVALLGESPILPGTRAKCLFDLLPTDGPFVDSIVDLKTTMDPSPHSRLGATWKFDYVMKLAYYGILAEAAGFGHRHRGILIWQRSSFPFDVHIDEISQRDMDIGRQVAINRVNRLAHLDQSRLDRHYDSDLHTLELADWQRNAYLSA